MADPPVGCGKLALRDHLLQRGYPMREALAIVDRTWALGGSERALRRAEEEILGKGVAG